MERIILFMRNSQSTFWTKEMFFGVELRSSVRKRKLWFSLLSDAYNYTGTCNCLCLQRIGLRRKVGRSGRSLVWDDLGQRTIVRLIIRMRINTGKQTDHPSRRTIWIIRVHRRITRDNSSERIIRL